MSDNIHFDLRPNQDYLVPKDVNSVIVHSPVKTIPDETFEGCMELVSISIPNSVKSIGEYAFYRCSQLQSVEIPASVTSIGRGAFFDCTRLKSIDLPDSMTTIGDGAFSGCVQLQSVAIPKSVTQIEEWAFYNCSELQSAVIPESVISIGRGAFYECSQLKLVTIPDTVLSIGERAFAHCSQLTSVIIPNSVELIGTFAFWKCKKLTVVSISKSVVVEEDAFEQCYALQQRRTNGHNYNADTATWLSQRFANLPLHQAFYNITNTSKEEPKILTKLLQQHKSTLIRTDAMGMTPLHILCGNPNVSFEMIQMVKAAQSDTTSMQNVVGKNPLMMILQTKGIQYDKYCDEVDGKLLPLVGLLEKGLDCDTLETILVFDNKVQLITEAEEVDATSGLIPFMYAARLEECRLDVMYKLAMQRPELLQNNIY